MKQDQDSKSRGDDKLGEGAPSDVVSRKMGLKISQFIKAFLDDLRIAWANSFKSAGIESTDVPNSHFLSRFLKRQIQNTRMFWASLMISSKRVIVGFAVSYVLLVLLFTGESSSNTKASLVEITKDAAFCSGYYESLVPGMAFQRQCAGTDYESVIKCRRWALNEWVELISLREDMAEHRGGITAAYRMTRMMPTGQNNEDDLKCSEVFNAVTDRMTRNR
jgi:hypothetical protein